MKPSHLVPIASILTALALSYGCATTPPDTHSLPPIATFAGIHIGYSTQEDLEHAWGQGLTITGGHPNSGRLWRVRDTNWLITTDGFGYSDRGLVIDGLQIASQRNDPLSMNVPFAKLDQKAFAWLGEISPGMTRLQVITSLNKQTLKFKEEGEILSMEADGFSAITSEANANIHRWQARLLFQEGKLISLQLDAGPA